MGEPLSAQTNGFRRASLSIEIRTKRFPFELGYFQGPAYYDLPPLRIIVHELIHFWQTLSTNFVADVALGEWNSLLQFERTGSVEELTGSRRRLSLADPQAGFSPNDLLESLARFWDIHILGPEKVLTWQGIQADYNEVSSMRRIREPDDPMPPYTELMFDSAISTESYSAPYNQLKAAVGSQSAVVAFPIIAYFSLQGLRPVEVYSAVVERLGQLLSFRSPVSIHDAWREYFYKLANLCSEVGAEIGAPVALPHSVLPTLSHGNLGGDANPLFIHYGGIIDGMDRSYGDFVDFSFALPGDPISRGYLLDHLLPPAAFFIDGRWEFRSLYQEQMENQSTEGGLNHVELADRAQEIHARLRDMRRQLLLTDVGYLR